jgi:hypothetical protein
MATMPPVLVVQMRRYFIDKDWRPKKMNVLVKARGALDPSETCFPFLSSGAQQVIVT